MLPLLVSWPWRYRAEQITVCLARHSPCIITDFRCDATCFGCNNKIFCQRRFKFVQVFENVCRFFCHILILFYCSIYFYSIFHVRMALGPNSSVSVYALHPGLVRTDFFRNHPWYEKCVIAPVTWLVSKDPWYGAQTTLYCAVDQSIELETGKYYRLVTGWFHFRFV